MVRTALVIAGVVLSPLGAFAQTDAGTPPPTHADAGMPADALPTIRPPLGHLQDVMDPPEKGGVPAGNVAVRAQFPGCPEPHSFYLSRALTLGAAGAGEQLSNWLTAQPELKKKLFGTKRDPLTEAVRKARSGMYFDGRACTATAPFANVPLVADGRITALEAPPALCKLDDRPAPEKGGVWLFANSKAGKVKQKDFTGAVSFLPPVEGAKKPCLPRLSVALFDDSGKTRLLYHADYNSAVEVELLGDKCQRVLFSFDAARQLFVPTVDKDPRCGKASTR